MKYSVVLASLLSVTLIATAQQTPSAVDRAQKAANGSPVVQKLDRAKIERILMKKYGGRVRDVREQRGSVVIVDAQSSAAPAWFDEVAKGFADKVMISINVEKGEFSFPKPQLKGAASVFIVDDADLPMSLVAPESKWAMVNVSPLKTDNAPFFEARVKKETARAMAYLLGAADSQYPNCLTGCVVKPEDLDRYPAVRFPVDLQQRFQKYPVGYGITPYKMSYYRTAVEEGWAAQPTNEFQKAIWDEIHTLPTKPITIEPETK